MTRDKTRTALALAAVVLLVAGCGPQDDPVESALVIQEALTHGADASLADLIRAAFESTGQELTAESIKDAGESVRQFADEANVSPVAIWECIPTHGGDVTIAAALCAETLSDPLSHIAALPIGETAPGTCIKALESAAASAEPHGLIKASLHECTTVEEWGFALSQHPGAMGLKDSAKLKVTELEAACGASVTEPVCVDAAARGLI